MSSSNNALLTPFGASRLYAERYRDALHPDFYSADVVTAQDMELRGQGNCMTYAVGMADFIHEASRDPVTAIRLRRTRLPLTDKSQYQQLRRTSVHADTLFTQKGSDAWRQPLTGNDKFTRSTLTLPKEITDTMQANGSDYVYTWGSMHSNTASYSETVAAGEAFSWPEDTNNHRVYMPYTLGRQSCLAIVELAYIERHEGLAARREAMAEGDYAYIPTMPKVMEATHPVEW